MAFIKMCREKPWNITFILHVIDMIQMVILHFYAPTTINQGHIVFVLFVCLFLTLTFAITFEP